MFLFALVVGGVIMRGVFSLCVGTFLAAPAARENLPRLLAALLPKKKLPLIPPAVQASFLFLVVVLFCFVCLFIFHIFSFSYWNLSFRYF